MKKIIQNLLLYLGYALIKKKKFKKLYRTLDHSIKIIIKNDRPVVFDVGAHTGETITRFRKLYKNCEIHSFEPQINSYQELKKFKDKNTIINNFALGDENENKKFYINKNDSTSGFYRFSKNNLIDKSDYCENVQVKTLDQYVEEKNIKNIDILKIDVQGYEDHVLRGATKTLKNNIKMIEVEIIFIDYYEKKSSFYELENIIRPYGYELYSISSPVLDENNDRIKWVDAIYMK